MFQSMSDDSLGMNIEELAAADREHKVIDDILCCVQSAKEIKIGKHKCIKSLRQVANCLACMTWRSDVLHPLQHQLLS